MSRLLAREEGDKVNTLLSPGLTIANQDQGGAANSNNAGLVRVTEVCFKRSVSMNKRNIHPFAKTYSRGIKMTHVKDTG